MDAEYIKSQVRDIVDFPTKGVIFKDLTTVFKKPDALRMVSDELYERYKNAGITKVVGVESRGFILASIVAYKLNAGFVPIRKPGKLPAVTWSGGYKKEYGYDTIEIHQDAITSDDVILLHDDVLATGGTMVAAYHLLQGFHPKHIYINFLTEIVMLDGRKEFPEGVEIDSLIKL